MLAPLVVAIAACEQPTAPQFLEATHRFERSLRDDPGAAARLARVLSDGNAARYLPTLGPIDLTVDGQATTYRGLVVERVVVPLDAADRFPCPRLRRTLYAVGEDQQVIVLSGTDFTRPIAPSWPGCVGLFYANGIVPYWQPPAAPHASGHFGGVEREGLAGVEGGARIAPVFAGGAPCTAFAPYDPNSYLPPTDCELVDFEVSMSVGFAQVREVGPSVPADSGRHPWSNVPPPVRLGPVKRVIARTQTVPGFRMTVYCRVGTRVGGCPVVD